MEIRNILVIRFRRVGDSVLSMGLCHTLRESFPGAEIDFVINKGIDSLYREHPDIDNVIVYDKKECDNIFKYIRKTRQTMKIKRYDIIIDIRGCPAQYTKRPQTATPLSALPKQDTSSHNA